MSLDVRPLTGTALEAALDQVANLRITVFREWPYLYDGTLEYERSYLDTYRNNPGALLVGAYDGERLVGASTSTLMEDHAEAFSTPFRDHGIALSNILYGAESLILPDYRGQGLGHRFIEFREAHARTMERSHVAFCSVLRADDHPLRPKDARSNDAFWRRHGYAPLPGVLAHFAWKDVGDAQESEKALQFWIRRI